MICTFRAHTSDLTDTHSTLGAQDHWLFESDPDARHCPWRICQPVCLWTGGVNMAISTFETLPLIKCVSWSHSPVQLQVIPTATSLFDIIAATRYALTAYHTHNQKVVGDVVVLSAKSSPTTR